MMSVTSTLLLTPCLFRYQARCGIEKSVSHTPIEHTRLTCRLTGPLIRYSFSVTVILRASPPSEAIDDFARGALADALELVAPLHHHQRVGREQIVEAQRLKLALAFEAIDVEVEELDGLAVARAVILVDEREGGTGDLVGLGCVERLRNAFHERGFARAQIAAQQQQLRRLEQIGELAAHRNRVRRRFAW